MSDSLSIVQKAGYLHATVTGENTAENVAGYLAAILRESTPRGSRRVLIEERLDGPRLRAIDVFRIASHGSVKAIGHFEAIAYVDVHSRGDAIRFAETVALNRMLPMTVHSTVADAEAWLRDATEKSPGSHHPRPAGRNSG